MFIIIIFFDPGTQFPRKEKITLCNIIIIIIIIIIIFYKICFTKCCLWFSASFCYIDAVA